MFHKCIHKYYSTKSFLSDDLIGEKVSNYGTSSKDSHVFSYIGLMVLLSADLGNLSARGCYRL